MDRILQMFDWHRKLRRFPSISFDNYSWHVNRRVRSIEGRYTSRSALSLLTVRLVPEGSGVHRQDWLYQLRLDWNRSSCARADVNARTFRGEHAMIKGEQARATLNEGTRPTFMQGTRIPFALRPTIEKELGTLAGSLRSETGRECPTLR